MDNPAKKFSVGMTPLFLVVLLFAIIVIELQLIAVQNKIDKLQDTSEREGSTTVTQTVSEDYSGKPDFKKRTIELTNDSAITNTVMTVDESMLIGLRCTEVMVNDGDENYWWRSPYEHDMYDAVDDPLAIHVLEQINATISEGRTVISARFCETEYGNIVSQYVVADEEDFGNRGFYHGRNADANITVLSPEGNFEDGGILMTTVEDWPYAICKQPIQLTSDGNLFVLCSVASGVNVSNTMHVVDLTTGTSRQVLNCSYSRSGGEIIESCEER